MVRRAVLGTPENSIPTAHLLFSSLQRSATSGSQKDGAGNMAVNQSAKSSPEHSAHARARVRDIAQRSIARSEGSAVATFNRWQISAIVMRGHSTRVGVAQDLVELDIDLAAIMQAGGSKSTRIPMQYAEKINAARSGMARAAASGRDDDVSQ